MNGPGVWGGRLQEGSLYVLLVMLPFSIAAVEIVFVVMLAGWVLQRIDPATRHLTLWTHRAVRPVLAAMIAYLAACALSIPGSAVPSVSYKALFTKWLEYLLLCFLTADVIHGRPAARRRAIVLLAVSAFLVAVDGIGQNLTGVGPLRGQKMYAHRMTGPYKNPIDLGTYLMVLVPVLLGYVLGLRHRARWLVGALIAVLLACLALTEAFGAWLGLAIGLAVIATQETAVRRAMAVALVFFLVIGGAVLHRTGRMNELWSVSELGKVDRIYMWRAAWGMIQDRPVLGHGLNTFMGKYLDYWVGGEKQPRYAHNCYLQVAAETGLIGLTAFLALLGALFWRMAVALGRVRAPERLLVLGMLAGLAAYSFQAGLDTNFYSLRQAALFWILAGLALGVGESAPWQNS